MNGDPKIVCLGANIESLAVLEALVSVRANIVGIITSHKKLESRGSDYRDLMPFSRVNSINLLRTDDINSIESKNFIRSTSATHLFILGWSQILDEDLINQITIYGSHPSKLPYGAGRAPIPWTIIERQESSAISIFEVVKEVDAGRIIYQREFDVIKGSTATELYSEVSKQLSIGFVKVYKDIKNDDLTPVVQDDSQRTIRAKRTPFDGKIDFSKPASEVHSLISAVTEPFPGAYSFFGGEKVTIWKSEEVEYWQHKGTIGQILRKESNKLLVQCGDKPIWLYDFSSDNHAQLSTFDFALGSSFGVFLEDEVVALRKEVEDLKKVIRRNGLI